MSSSKCIDEIDIATNKQLLQLENLDTRDQENTVKAEQNNRDAVTSHLPDEIIAMIFEAGVRQAESGELFGVLVSHVSNRWRSIALETSRLWTNIDCIRTTYSVSNEEETAGWLKRVSTFFSRSKSSPVNIQIHGLSSASIDTDFPLHDTDFTIDFISLISNHIRHCRQLLIDGIPVESLRLLLDSCSCQPAPLLRTFKLTMECKENVGFRWPLAAPALASVGLHNVIHSHHLRSSLPSFGPISSLQLGHISITTPELYTSLRDALMTLNSLTHLDLEVLAFFRSPSTLPITLPGLQILELDVQRCNSRDGKAGKNFINSILAPSLINLALLWDNCDADPPWSTSEESRIPSLRHLLLLGSTALLEINWLARTFSNIDRLSCWQGTDVDDILAAIVEGAGNGDEGGPGVGDKLRWPKLHSVGVWGSDSEKPINFLDSVVLRNAIPKLQEGGRPFRTLCCLYPYFAHFSENTMAELNEIIAFGDLSDDWPLPFNFQ